MNQKENQKQLMTIYSSKLTIAESSGDGGSNTMMFVAIGAVIAVVALVAVYFVFVRKP